MAARRSLRLVEPRLRGDAEDLERVEPPRARGHHAHERDVVLGVRDRPQALLEVPDLRRLEQRQAADDGVRDVLVAQPLDDGVAVPVLAIQDGDVAPARLRPARGRGRLRPPADSGSFHASGTCSGARGRVQVVPLGWNDPHIAVLGGPVASRERPDRVDDRDRLVLGARADVELDRDAGLALGPQALVGLVAGLVAADEPVGAGQDVADGAEVLLDP